jgi:transcriptional regulator with XRE-family HTH domain
MDARAAVARNIRKFRVGRGLSQEALAVDAAIDRTYIGRLERGQENPTVVILERLAGALGVAPADLLREPEPGEAPPAVMPSGRKKRHPAPDT